MTTEMNTMPNIYNRLTSCMFVTGKVKIADRQNSNQKQYYHDNWRWNRITTAKQISKFKLLFKFRGP